MQPIYLDYNATTPIDRRVADAMVPYLYEHFGNPSSTHALGVVAKEALEEARTQVAALLGATPAEVAFTSGGTESNNLAILGTARRQGTGHIITSVIEHPAVLAPCAQLEREGFQVTRVSVDETGTVDPQEIQDAIRRDTILISIMHANNEVGTIQPIEAIAKIARAHDVLLHVDAAQSVGKIPTDVRAMGVDMLTVAGHKFYAPKGVGALFVRRNLPFPRLLFGASQEHGRRPGTENILEVVGLGKAAEIAREELSQETARMKRLSERLWEGLCARLDPPPVLHGHPEARLPNTLNVGFVDIVAPTLLERISDKLAVSAGSACHAELLSISPVLQAMQVPLASAKGALRLSLGRMTDAEKIDQATEHIAQAVHDLRPS